MAAPPPQQPQPQDRLMASETQIKAMMGAALDMVERSSYEDAFRKMLEASAYAANALQYFRMLPPQGPVIAQCYQVDNRMQQALRALNDIYWKGLAPPGRLAPGAGTAAAAAAAAPVPPQQLPTAQLHSAQSSLHRGAAGAASVSRGRTATSTGRTSLPGASSSASSAPQAQAQQLNQVLTRLRQDWENNEVARTIQAVREKWVRERQEQLAARHHRRQQEMTNLVTAAQSAETREEIFAFDAQPGAKTYETLLMVQASEVDVEPARQHVEAILSLDQHPLTRRLIEGRRDLILRYYVPKDGPEGSSSVLAGSGDTVKEMLAETAQLLDQVALLLFDAYPDLLLNPATAPSPASAADAVHHDHQGAGGIGGAGGGGAASVGGAANPRSPQHDGTAADTASRFFTVKSLAQPFMRRERAATGPPAPTAATVTSALASDMTDEEDLEDRRDAVRALVRKALQDFFFTEKVWALIRHTAWVHLGAKESLLRQRCEQYITKATTDWDLEPELCLDSGETGKDPYAMPVDMLKNMSVAVGPQNKLEHLVAVCDAIIEAVTQYNTTHNTRLAIGADQLVPIISHVVRRSGRFVLIHELLVILELMNERDSIAKAGYVYASVQTAVDDLATPQEVAPDMESGFPAKTEVAASPTGAASATPEDASHRSTDGEGNSPAPDSGQSGQAAG